MNQKTLVIILLFAILSAVGIVASITLYNHQQERRDAEEDAAFWQAQCERDKQSGIKFENDYCDE